MSNKQTFKLNMPEINLYIIVIGISSIILLYYNLYVGCLFFCIFVYMFFTIGELLILDVMNGQSIFKIYL